MNNRAGHIKSNLSGEMAYNSFVPAPLPPNPPIELNDEIINLLIKANSKLSLLEGLALRIKNIELFISMYVHKEALMSSQIEGTQATLEDVLDPTINSNTNQDVSDVVNYIKAINFAIKRLETLPLCNLLIKETHCVLMDGVRGQEKTPAEFRYSQNWIGGQGSNLKNARYVPPTPQDMIEAMSDLEKFINAEDDIDPLIKIALIHYQFETIHPFLDGNGRIGRLLIVLFLIEKKILTTPALYISYYLKKNRVEYYDRMTLVRWKGNFEQWITFFLQAIIESSEDAITTIDKLIALHNHNIEIITKIKSSAKSTLILFNYLESCPIIEIQKTSEILNLSFNTTSSAIMRLIDVGILYPNSENKRNRTYSYKAYLDILRNGTEL